MTQRIVVTSNSAEVNARLAKRVKASIKDVQQLVVNATNLVEETVVKGIHGPPKTGILYEKGSSFRGNRPSHRASAPGEYPATDTGYLAQNISSTMSVDRLTGRITSEAEYSKDLEYGRNGVAARPFMQPSLEKNRRKILGWFKRAKLMRDLS